MDLRRITAIVLLGITVLPATVVAALVAFIGLPFWVAGIVDFFMGNYGWNEFQSASRPDIVLLFISAPLGVFGLVTLWCVLLNIIRNRRWRSRRLVFAGLLCGIFSSAHLLIVKFGLPLLLLPATLFALYQLSRSVKDTRESNGA